jgi:hypothetical protein
VARALVEFNSDTQLPKIKIVSSLFLDKGKIHWRFLTENYDISNRVIKIVQEVCTYEFKT